MTVPRPDLTARPPLHPLAFPDNRTGFCGIMSGSRVVVGDRHGWLDEALSDGDALVTFDSGEYATVKWRFVSKETRNDVP